MKINLPKLLKVMLCSCNLKTPILGNFLLQNHHVFSPKKFRGQTRARREPRAREKRPKRIPEGGRRLRKASSSRRREKAQKA